MNNITPFTGTHFEVDPYPDYSNTQGPLLGVYSIEAVGDFEASKPYACIIARDEEEALMIALAEGISMVLNVVLVGYALPKYIQAHVLYINNGEYLHQDINN
jgi:hypothetical protein